MPQRPKLSFPKRFLWGVSTSAHQVEGGNHNQWSVWELENAKSLAAQAPYQYDDLANWPDIRSAAKSASNYVSGKAANHYTLYEQDIQLVKKMNMNAFRFSVEWSRIEPEQGVWNAEAVEHYKSVLAELKKQDIEPIVTLFHFTLPVWFAKLGGFEKRANIDHFVNFSERILAELGSAVKYVITINEPEVYAIESYYRAKWPPQVQSLRKTVHVMNNLARAHNRISKHLRAMSRRYKVSVSDNGLYVYPGDDSALSVRAAAVIQYLNDDYFMKKVVKNCDFIGVNYYFSNRVYGYRVHNPNDHVNDLGWSMEPEHIQRMIERLYEKYQLPIFITENGTADAKDEHRKWWITQTVMGINKAMTNGAEVIGYLHWSLIDNFEWDKGFWPRFGLFEVDYKTGKRTPRPSAVWFARVLKTMRG